MTFSYTLSALLLSAVLRPGEAWARLELVHRAASDLDDADGCDAAGLGLLQHASAAAARAQRGRRKGAAAPAASTQGAVTVAAASSAAATAASPQLPAVFSDCLQDHSADLDKPLTQVRAEHPDEDLFCYFAKDVFWFQGHSLMANKTYTSLMAKMFDTNPFPDGVGPLVTYHMDGTPPQGISAHMDVPGYAYSDLYCYVSGWMRNQGLNGSIVDDPEARRLESERQCEMIGREFNFSPEELTIRNHLAQNNIIAAGALCAASQFGPFCRKVTTRELKLHAYQKCLVGDLGPDLAQCLASRCLLGSARIGHYSECP